MTFPDQGIFAFGGEDLIRKPAFSFLKIYILARNRKNQGGCYHH
jgi:hypothetical protein